MNMGGGFSVSSLKTMIYTPCNATLSSSTALTGQIYAGQVTMSGAGVLTFDPIGLPGYDISNGTATYTPSPTVPRDLLLMRNIDVG